MAHIINEDDIMVIEQSETSLKVEGLDIQNSNVSIPLVL